MSQASRGMSGDGPDVRNDQRPEAGPPAHGLRCHRLSDPFVALGHAVDLLRQVQPFASFTFGAFAGTLGGQIGRGHYLFALKGNQVVGYMGWALCDGALARDRVAGGRTPTYEECRRAIPSSP